MGPTFSEMVRRRMRYDRSPKLVFMQDKYKVREYAQSRGVSAAQLFYVTDKPESIPFDILPDRYLIKANHGWKWNILSYDSIFYLFGHGDEVLDSTGKLNAKIDLSKYIMTRDNVIALCKRWLNSRHFTREWAYQRIIPKIIVEEFLDSEDGAELKDYRFYTFNGCVKTINIGCSSYRKNRENIFFTPDWQEVELTVTGEARPYLAPARPHNLDEMVAKASALGKGIDFVRVDLYNSSKGVLLGELTVYPQSGIVKSPTACPEFNRWLGSCWVDVL